MICGLSITLGEPGTQRADSLPAQRRAAIFSSLTSALNVGTGAEDNVLTAQPDQLRDPQARLHGNEEECPVPPTCPRRLIGCCHEGLDLGPCKELDLRAVVALLWYRQNALSQGAHARLMESNIAEERMKGSQAGISAAGAIAALFFEMVEEGADERSIQILEVKHRGRFLQTLPGKCEEQTEGVPVTGNGVRACLPLAHEAVGEECLEQGGEVGIGLHRHSPPLPSRRRVANCKSSGTAEIYQYVSLTWT
jgi:hypothetical protein